MSSSSSIEIKNIYYMLSYVFESLRQNNFDRVQTEDFDNVKDLFAVILATGIASQIKRGLVREYVENNENLFTVRGRIDIGRTVQLKKRQQQSLACSFDELSENHLMNQILKTTALFLLRDDDVRQVNKNALKSTILFFHDVDSVEPSSINWRLIHFHRNNATYQMLMNICYLVLHDLLLTTEQGERKLASFIDDKAMASLFEKFVLAYYRKHFPELKPRASQIDWNAEGDIKHLPRMKTDTVLSDGARKLIIDTKYYTKIMSTYWDATTIRSAHLYQIFAYVKNEDKMLTGHVDGLLLYAKTDEERVPDSTYMLGGNRVSVRTLDLDQEFLGIRSQLDRLVVDWQHTQQIAVS